MAKTKFRFSIFGLSHRLCRGSEVRVGSEDQLQNLLKGIFVQGGQVEHILTMANLKLKPSLFMPRPDPYISRSVNRIFLKNVNSQTVLKKNLN